MKYFKGISLSKNKYFELQIDSFEPTWFEFTLNWTRNCDHAGFRFEFQIWSFYFNVTVYDTRHWDEDKKQFKG